jgi:hypothetical protein
LNSAVPGDILASSGLVPWHWRSHRSRPKEKIRDQLKLFNSFGLDSKKFQMDTQTTKADIQSAVADLSNEAAAAVANAKFVHAPIARVLSALNWERQHYADFVNEKYDQISRRVKQRLFSHQIPPFYHKIWITDPDNPALPTQEYIDRLIVFARDVPNEWTMFFWVNSDTVASHIKSSLGAKIPSLVISDIDLFIQKDALHHVYGRLFAERKFVLAGDILKVAVLHRIGGLYSDIGLQITSLIFDLCRYVDHVFLLGHAVFLQTSLLASAPKSSLLAFMVATMLRPEIYDREFIVTGAQITATDEVRVFSGVGATIASLFFVPPGEGALFLPYNSKYLEWRAQGSWYKQGGLHGNAVIAESKPTFLSDELYANRANVSDRVTISGQCPEFVRRKLLFLLSAEPNLENESAEIKCGGGRLLDVLRHSFLGSHAAILYFFFISLRGFVYVAASYDPGGGHSSEIGLEPIGSAVYQLLQGFLWPDWRPKEGELYFSSTDISGYHYDVVGRGRRMALPDTIFDLLLIDAKLEGAIDAAHLKAAVQNLSSYGLCIIGELDASQLDQVASHLQASKISFLVIKGKTCELRGARFLMIGARTKDGFSSLLPQKRAD